MPPPLACLPPSTTTHTFPHPRSSSLHLGLHLPPLLELQHACSGACPAHLHLGGLRTPALYATPLADTCARSAVHPARLLISSPCPLSRASAPPLGRPSRAQCHK